MIARERTETQDGSKRSYGSETANLVMNLDERGYKQSHVTSFILL